MIERLCDKGSLEKAIDLLSSTRRRLSPNIYLSILKACCRVQALLQAKQVQTHLAVHRVPLSGLLGDYLVVTLARCGAFEDALLTSYTLPSRTVFSWTAIISAYADEGLGHEALSIGRLMEEDGLQPDRYTIVSLVKACGIICDLKQGMHLHAEAVCKGFTSDVFVLSTVISMYGKCCSIAEAEHVFSKLHNRQNVVCWNAMLSGYVDQGYAERALQLYVEMQDKGVETYQLTYVITLQACATVAGKCHSLINGYTAKKVALEIGRALHADARKKGVESNILVGSTLVTMYGRCGIIQEAEHVFSLLSEHSLTSWTAMLSTYVDQGYPEKALQMYSQLLDLRVIWDDVLLTCVLQACSATGSLETCKSLHSSIVSAGHDYLPHVAATLIHAYGSCAKMVDGQAVFDGFLEPTIVLWNACIAGHVGEQDSLLSLQMFESLKLSSVTPDGVTFNSVLSACSHCGFVTEGIEYCRTMVPCHHLSADIKHYGSIVDLAGRAGNFKMVENILKGLPVHPDLSIWLCLLGACRAHSNIELATEAFDHAVCIKPNQDTAYIVMSNMYADVGLSEESYDFEMK